MLPDFLRFFADTSDSAIGHAAFSWCKSLCRVAPVRVVSLSGGFAGTWQSFQELMLTPMVGNYVNCVCAHPRHWAYTQSVPAPDRAFGGLEHHVVDGKKADEVLTGNVEIYTTGVRNVLMYMAAMSISQPQFATAMKYEAIVCASVDDAMWWGEKGLWWGKILVEGGRQPEIYFSRPGLDHNAVRAAVLGPAMPSEGVYR